MSKLILRAEAEQDIADAYAWYEEQSPGLGRRFLERLERTLERVEGNPRHYQVLYRGIRRALTDRFPYGVYYRETSGHVSVLAVMHTARSPEAWKSRDPRL